MNNHHTLIEVELLKSQNKAIQDHLSKLQDQMTIMTQEMAELKSQLTEGGNQTNQEVYYQRLLENMFPGAGHMTLRTTAGSRFITDLTSPDCWVPSEHDGMPSFHIEIKNTLKYNEIPSQLSKAQAALPRQLLLGVLFLNPPLKKLKDTFELLHPQGMKLAFFDHDDQLWWFDGQRQRCLSDLISSFNRPVRLNPLEHFVKENVEFVKEHRIPLTQLYHAYDTWCVKSGYGTVKLSTQAGKACYRKDLKDQFKAVFGDRASELMSSGRFWVGIRIRT